jgi:NNP family nitrate/nitrite transporter-like MFS transporter
LNLSQNEIANSNILALTATLLVRIVAGPLCDRFGPRIVFAGCLLAGAIPTALAFTIKDATGLIILRFFVGILGGSFVPCQVWSMGFFDKNIVGTANAFTGGFGNAGGGITYFIMPALFDHFEKRYHMSAHKAWRVAFEVPFAIIVATAVLMLLLTPDTPVGKWSTRHEAIEANLREEHAAGHIVPHSGIVAEHHTPIQGAISDDKKHSNSDLSDVEHGTGAVVEVDAEYIHEVIAKPTIKEMIKIAMSPQTLVLCALYFNSFGSELSINSILGAYYLKNFPKLGQTSSGKWAAMFGLLNIYGRPIGGIVSDLLYKYTKGSLWAKKAWVHALGIIMGIMMIAIGTSNPHHLPTMIGLVAGLAFFMDAGNGANFALVPHIHPQANGKSLFSPLVLKC